MSLLLAVLGYGLRLLGLFVVWHLARSVAASRRAEAEGRKRGPEDAIATHIVVITSCLLVTWFFWMSYGAHTEASEDSDPLFGGTSETITDFEPTPAQRMRHVLPIALTVLPVALHGTWHGRRHWQKVVREDRA